VSAPAGSSELRDSAHWYFEAEPIVPHRLTVFTERKD